MADENKDFSKDILDAIIELKTSFEKYAVSNANINQTQPDNTKIDIQPIVDAINDNSNKIIEVLNNNTSQDNSKTKNGNKNTNQVTNTANQLSKLTTSLNSLSNIKSLSFLKGTNVSSLVDSFGQINNSTKSTTASISKMSVGANALLIPLQAVDKILKDKILKFLDLYITKTLDLLENLYDAEVELQKTLGISRDASAVSSNAFRDVRVAGIGIEEVNKSYSSLFTNTSRFSTLSKGLQEELIEQGSILQANGFSIDAYSFGLQVAAKGMGMTEQAASQMNSRIVALGMDIGVSAEKMGSDFKASSDVLYKLGANGEQAFRRLAIASKATGIEVSRLIAITEKFDTFDGAAEQAGKLNAALGGNFVNAMDLMMAEDPVERFNMIRDSITDAGLSFDTMSYYQKVYFKNALGLNDIGELAGILSGDFGALQGQIGKTSADFKTMRDRAQSLQKLKDFFENLFYNSIIPVLNEVIPLIQDFVNSLTGNDILGKIKDYTSKIILAFSALSSLVSIITGILAAIAAVSGVGMPLAIALGSISVASGTAGASIGFLGAGVSTFMNSTSSLTKVIDKLKKAFTVLIEPFQEVLDKYEFTSEASDFFLGIMDNLIWVLGGVADAMAFVVKLGLMLADAFGILRHKVTVEKNSPTLFMFFVLLGPLLIALLGPIGMVITSIGLFVSALNILRVNFSGVFDSFDVGFSSISSFFDSLATGIVSFSSVIGSIPQMITTLSKMSNTKLYSTIKLFREIKEAAKEINDIEIDSIDSFLSVTKQSIAETQNKATRDSMSQITINLTNNTILDGKVVDSRVSKVMDKEVKDSMRFYNA